MRTLWKFIASLFKWSWRVLNFARQLFLNIIFIVLIIAIFGAYSYLKTPDTPVISKQGALYVNLSGVVVDQISRNNQFGQLGRQLLGASSNRIQENSLFDIVDTIRAATDDDNIKGMVLKLDDFVGASQPSLQYIGKAINEFKKKGKPVYAVSNNYNQSQYLLASYADKIYLPPQGSVDVYGYALNNVYYKSLLDSLKINTHIFRVGTYKSAVEPMMRDDMSTEARLATRQFIDILWDNYLNSIAQNRKIEKAQVFPGSDAFITKLKDAKGDLAQYALDQKLIDEIATNSIFEQEMTKTFGWDNDSRFFNAVSIYDYKQSSKQTEQENPRGNIAVIVAQGVIIDGQQTSTEMGSETTAAQIRDARLSPQIKAIILRVNTPGGSATASEEIRAELVAARKAGKPIVVSMGDMAASGGYWISTPADYIIASPSTITGSIGIFGVITTFENSLKEIGVYTDGVSTSPLAGSSLTTNLSPQFAELMQISIEKGYSNFIDIVAKSRHKTAAQVDEIAQGRVWAGVSAKENGLVDQLGDFDDAIAKAAELAKVSTPTLDWMQPELSFFDKMMLELSTSAQVMMPDVWQAIFPAPLAQEFKQQTNFLRTLNDPQFRYAYCLNCEDIR